MKKAIIYVRTDYWAAKAVQDLLTQERRCLAYAEANGLTVAKVFREKPWEHQKKGQISAAVQYIKDSAGEIDLLIVYRPKNLDSTKMYWIKKIAMFRSIGMKIVFVSLENKNK
jgi:hypothetical protein